MRLTLIFSRWMSLARWDELGMFDRETALYRRLSGMGADIAFLTWGSASELDFRSRLPGISILCNRFSLRGKHYERLAPFLHAPRLLSSQVIKTNQSSAAVIAVPTAKLWRKPLLARMGFMASDFTLADFGENSNEYRQEIEREDQLFKAARWAVVTTHAMADAVRQRHPHLLRRVEIIPNYVDTDLFRPMLDVPKRYDVIFIGRLAKQKNIGALLAAVTRLGCKALIVGDGPLAEMAERAVAQGVIDWYKSVPNAELAFLIAQSRLFILPSLWEGHPKTLIEAMSAGAAVIGARSPGIQEQIKHGDTGFICDTSEEDIAQAIRLLLNDDEQRHRLGERARAHALANWSLDRVASQEMALLRKVAGIRS